MTPSLLAIDNVEFAGNDTLTPTFVSPAPLSALPEAFKVNFTLPESAQAGSVQLVLDPQLRDFGKEDATQARVLTFAEIFEVAGVHTANMVSISTVSQLAFVDSADPPVNLVDGAIYTAQLRYGDSVGHGVAFVNP